MEDVCFVNLDGAEDESDISGLVWNLPVAGNLYGTT